MPLTTLQLGQMRDERRLQLKRAAITVFARRGVRDTKMAMIADEAGVSHGLFYRYFTSKDALFTEVVSELMESAFSAIDSIEQLPGTPSEQLTAFTEVMLSAENRPGFMLIHRARADEAAPKKVRQLLAKSTTEAFVGRLVPLFKRGQRSGEFVRGDALQVLGWYFTVINSVIVWPHSELPPAAMLMRLIRSEA